MSIDLWCVLSAGNLVYLGDTKMALTITLGDDLVGELEKFAKWQQLSVEQIAIGILTDAMAESETETLLEVVARIQALPPNPSMFRPAVGNLADVLRDGPDYPSFDLESCNRQWEAVEAEMKAITRADDVAEGRGG
jgi:hypothetical protein